jgi:DNA modification methylase
VAHPTQKPLSLIKWNVQLLTDKGDMVLDPFMGSGTTLVACAKLGRKGIGIELDPDYFQIACERVHKAYQQPDLFIAPPEKPVQEVLL